MNALVNHRFALATALTRQYDTLMMNEITARYNFEMHTTVFPENRGEIENLVTQMKKTEAARLACEKIIENITGLTVDQLRTAQTRLETVLGRQIEVEVELFKGELLSPVFAEALKLAEDNDETKEARETLAKRAAEMPVIQKHYDELNALVEQIAGEIGFRDISQIATVSSKLLVPR